MAKKFNMKESLMNKIKEDFEKRDRGGVQAKQYLKLENGASLYKPKTGKNAIDIIPFQHKTNVFGKKGEFDYMLDLFVHKNFNQSYDKCLCLKKNFGKPCPICEAYSQLQEMDEEKYEDTINSYKPKRRVLMNVVNLKEDEEDEHNGEVQILDEVYYFFQKELIEEACADDAGDPVDFVDPEEGLSVFFRATAEKLGSAKFHKFKSFTFEERDEPYAEDFIEKHAFALDSLIHVPTYEEVEAMLNEEAHTEEDEDEPDEIEDDTEDDEEEVEVEVKKTVKRGIPKKTKVVEPEDDEEEIDIEDDEEAEVADELLDDEDDDDDDDSQCPYGKTFGVDGDMADKTCLKCKKSDNKTFKECVIASLD